MRTLKKTLALVLVLAMMFSLCITASAADFADEEDIQNELAVNVLYELKVINGMPDGTYDPAGTLTRAQAAKILCHMLGVAEFIEQCPTDFTDVAESHWASGYIAYCADQGIIDGYGDGKFGPSDTLTGYAWAKMLLVAYGLVTDYEADGFIVKPISLTGASWQILTAKYATNAGLWLGDNTSKKEACTRDNAALHAFNVLYGEKAAEIALSDNSAAETIGEADFGYALLEKEVVRDDFKAPYAYVWALVPAGVADVEDEDAIVVLTEAIAPVKTYTAGVTFEKIEEDLALAEDAEPTFTYYVNGVEKDMGEYAAKKGAVADVYDMGDDKYEVVAYSYYIAEATVVEATDDAEAYIDLGAGKKTDVIEGVEDGDYVLYTAVGTKVITAEEVEGFEGKVTAIAGDGKSYKIDGTSYENANSCGYEPKIGDEKVFYLDKAGYVKLVTEKDGAPVDEEKAETLVYVVGYYSTFVKGTAAEYDKYGNVVVEGKADSYDRIAQVVTMDGEVAEYLYRAGDENAQNYYKQGAVMAISEANEDGEYSFSTPTENVIAASAITKDGLKFVVDGVNYYYNGAEFVAAIGIKDKLTVAAGTAEEAAENATAYAIFDGEGANMTVSKVIYWLDKEVEETPDPEAPTYLNAILSSGTGLLEESTIVTGQDEETGEDIVVPLYTYKVWINGEEATINTYEKLARDFYEYYVDELGVYVVRELDGMEAEVTNVYGNYASVAGFEDYDISGIKVVDLTENGNGTIEKDETIALYAYKAKATDTKWTIDCIYIIESVVADAE